jgi:hypothetical protein
LRGVRGAAMPALRCSVMVSDELTVTTEPGAENESFRRALLHLVELGAGFLRRVLSTARHADSPFG